MKITRVNVAEYAGQHGLSPTKVDGIPEGFSFKSDGIYIGPTYYSGQKFAFVPLLEWNDGMIQENTTEELLSEYNKRNGKRN